jgi:uroporphyrinogen-III synthase
MLCFVLEKQRILNTLIALGPEQQLCSCVNAGGLVEPPVVPRFIGALTAAGAAAVRVPAYLTTPGLDGPERCTAEAGLLHAGHIHAIAFSSTAEVG